jgi:hypothetical protein
LEDVKTDNLPPVDKTTSKQQMYKIKVEANLALLEKHVKQEQPRLLQELRGIHQNLLNDELKLIQKFGEITDSCAKTKEELPRQSVLGQLQTLSKLRNYVKSRIDFLESGFDAYLLQNRIQEMQERNHRIKLKDKTERSPWDVYNSVFDLSATTAKNLMKNHCDKCEHPLTANKKHALLQCHNCGKATEQLIPLSTPHHAGQHAQNMMGRTAGFPAQRMNPQDSKRTKAVTLKLQQFRVGEVVIPHDLLILIKDTLKKKDHINAAFVALPTPVADVLKNIPGKEHFARYKDKIANMINGVAIQELTDAQINEITSRLKVVQMMYRFLRTDTNDHDHQYINFFVNRICNMLGWKQLADLFPIQRTSSTLKTQMDMWRVLIKFLQCIDSNFQWHEGY